MSSDSSSPVSGGRAASAAMAAPFSNAGLSDVSSIAFSALSVSGAFFFLSLPFMKPNNSCTRGSLIRISIP